MKIGLLECDHVRDELRHIAGDYRDMFPALFETVAPHWQWRFFDVVNGQFPESVQECDAYLCTGSRFSVYDKEPWIERLKDFVRVLYNAQKPFVGVCFGHQMLAEALGGKVAKAAAGWCVGVHSFEMPNTNLNLLMMCQDQVMALPPQAKILAGTPQCPVVMFQVSDFMLGIQAHPEFSKDYEAALINLRIERIGSERAEAALESLALPIHGQDVAQLIFDFLTR
jgi:GMP synthase-like glutamine amidotransferase